MAAPTTMPETNQSALLRLRFGPRVLHVDFCRKVSAEGQTRRLVGIPEC